MQDLKESIAKIQENQKDFQKLIFAFNLMPDFEGNAFSLKKFDFACDLLRFLTYKPIGAFYSPRLEPYFLDVAKIIDIDKYHENYQKNTFLHVMTEAYEAGGHTRVVERWIGTQSESCSHSVVFTGNYLSEFKILKQNVKKTKGKMGYLTRDANLLDKALELREIALNYEYIVLHTHMEDPVATLAFGTEKFKRPVILFNHGDHMFWIGKSIADAIFEFRKIKNISAEKRLISNTFKCPIPVSNEHIELNKHSSREKLGFSQEEKILVTSGAPNKFSPAIDTDFFDVIEEVLENHEVKLYVIGVEYEDENWARLAKYFEKKLFLIGTIDFKDGFLDYVCAADLVLDSHPMGGCTALIDAISCKTPYVSLDSQIGQADFVVESEGFCATKEDFVKKIKAVLESEVFTKKLYENEVFYFEKDHSPENWLKNLEEILAQVPKIHKVKDISKEEAPCFIDEYTLTLYSLYKNIGFDFNLQSGKI